METCGIAVPALGPLFRDQFARMDSHLDARFVDLAGGGRPRSDRNDSGERESVSLTQLVTPRTISQLALCNWYGEVRRM